MKAARFVLAALCAALLLVEIAEAAPDRKSAGRRRGSSAIGARVRPVAYRSRRSRTRRSSQRTVVRHVGVTLPQLRTELTRLENGLGTRVQQMERAVARPPVVRPVVIQAPPAPTRPEPTVPVAAAAASAMALAAAAGAVGFVLGRRHALRSGGASAAKPSVEHPGNEGTRHRRRAAPSWSQLRQRLDETQQRLSAARTRLGRLERRA
jgi:hypothetical protein